ARIETTGQNLYPRLQRIVILVLAFELESLPEVDLVLDAAPVRDNDKTSLVARYRRQIGLWLWPGGFPRAEVLFNHSTRLLGCHLSDHNDRGQIRTKNLLVILAHIVQRQRCDRL